MNLRWTAYVAPSPPNGFQKHKMAFSVKKCALHLKKFYYKVSLCEYCQRCSRSTFSFWLRKIYNVSDDDRHVTDVIVKADEWPTCYRRWLVCDESSTSRHTVLGEPTDVLYLSADHAACWHATPISWRHSPLLSLSLPGANHSPNRWYAYFSALLGRNKAWA